MLFYKKGPKNRFINPLISQFLYESLVFSNYSVVILNICKEKKLKNNDFIKN